MPGGARTDIPNRVASCLTLLATCRHRYAGLELLMSLSMRHWLTLLATCSHRCAGLSPWIGINTLREAGSVLSHLALSATAAAEFLPRWEGLPGLVPLHTSLVLGVWAPHLGFPPVQTWNSKVDPPHFPCIDYCCFIHCRL